MHPFIGIGLLLALQVHAQSSSTDGRAGGGGSSSISSIILSGTRSFTTSILFGGGDFVPTGSQVSYLSYSTTVTLSSTTDTVGASNSSATSLSFASTNTSVTSSSSVTTTPTATLLVGTNGASSSNGTSTSTASEATNTQSCNNYPEFCSRSYSNITYVAAHNSPFVNANNAAANQDFGVLDQLNDGIRMLQGQTHYMNDTVFFCHTSCYLFNGGTAEAYFANVSKWLAANPYDVVTILIGNGDFINVENYTAPLKSSGLSRYAYIPPKIPMTRSDWPTLASLILANSRAIIFMDYQANQTSVPYILDEFSQLWETPFSPTNDSFPCTADRPPGIKKADAENRMYMANHNLNTEIDLFGASILVPTTVKLNTTNAVSGFGSLGLAANHCVGTSCPFPSFSRSSCSCPNAPQSQSRSSQLTCPLPQQTEAWTVPPNFLLVDYYNRGSSPGSVFEVAAQHNNVTYNRKCCGSAMRSGSSRILDGQATGMGLIVLLVSAIVVFW